MGKSKIQDQAQASNVSIGIAQDTSKEIHPTYEQMEAPTNKEVIERVHNNIKTGGKILIIVGLVAIVIICAIIMVAAKSIFQF